MYLIVSTSSSHSQRSSLRHKTSYQQEGTVHQQKLQGYWCRSFECNWNGFSEYNFQNG